MTKIAKLVTVSVTTRVIIEDTDDDEKIMKIAMPRLIQNLNEDGILDHFESIEDDKEMPFNENSDHDRFFGVE